jgi:hypothetical protein
MPSLRLTCLFTLASLLGAADAPPQEETPTPAPAAAAPAAQRVVNTGWLKAVEAYAQSRGMAVADVGAGPVRARLLGGAAYPEVEKALELGSQTLQGLEVWSGKNGVFLAEKPAEEDVLWLVVFPSADAYSGWVDFLQAKKITTMTDPGLTKKTSGFPGGRTLFVKAEAVKMIPLHYAVYGASCMSLDAFYLSRGKSGPPPWIREGCLSEMQRLLCAGTIRSTTIAYQLGTEPVLTEGWGKEVAKLMRSGDKRAVSMSEVMRTNLDALAPVYYYQMWSGFSFVRSLCGSAKGPKNKFLAILDATAAGASSDLALKQVLGKADPGLSGAWREWAMSAGAK